MRKEILLILFMILNVNINSDNYLFKIDMRGENGIVVADSVIAGVFDNNCVDGGGG